MNSVQRCAFLAVSAWSLAGCSTPRPALDLASQGALVVDQAQTEVQGFIDRSELAYKAREGIVRDLARSDIVDTSQADFRGWVSREADNAGKDADRTERIKRIVAQSRAAREKLEADLAAKSKAIGAIHGGAATVPFEKTAAAKKAFANLAQELSAEEWLRFSWKYAKELNENIKTLKAAEPAAAAPAASAP